MVIFGLNGAYSTLVTVLENSSRKEDLTFDETVAALLEESRRKTINEEPVALLTRTSKLVSNQKEIKEAKCCDHCHRIGHTKEQRFKLHPEHRRDTAKKQHSVSNKKEAQQHQQGPNENNKAEAYMATTTRTIHLTWYLDSAATNHIYQSKEDFVFYNSVTSSITVGRQNAVKVLGRGSIRIEFLLGDGSINEVLLTNVLHAPQFGTNLVSATAS
jgi:hypothetical protein